MIRVAINGFGRIGRSVLRALYEGEKQNVIQIVAINELAPTAEIAHLLQYDSSHGRFFKTVSHDQQYLYIHQTPVTNTSNCQLKKQQRQTASIPTAKHTPTQEQADLFDRIHLFHIDQIDLLPWDELNIDIVLDCTGRFGSQADGELHIRAGAKKVLFSHPGSHDLDNTVIFGVNDHTLLPSHSVVSNGSCTTNCIVPVIKVLDEAFGIESGTITSIHSSMNDQQVIDAYHPDLRRSRAASQSIIPVDTKLHLGIGRIYPKFADKFEAISVRVPTINVTAMDLSVTVNKHVTIDDINQAMFHASNNELTGVLDYTEAALVSIDFNHDPHSAIVDSSQTRVSNQHLVKMLVWCDNEWGFANRMLDTAFVMGGMIREIE